MHAGELPMLSVHNNAVLGVSICGAGLLIAMCSPAGAVVCSPTKMSIAASTKVGNDRTSTTFGNIPEAVVSFTQGKAGCVVVRFSAVTFTANDGVKVRAVMDGHVQAVPPEVYYSTFNAGTAARSYDFVFANVAPGTHRINMQYRSNDGDQVTIHEHTTIVQYAP
jgi:hypothetical protein